MQNIKSFNEISYKDTSIAGGKGASLGEMTQINLPIPSGFVITTEIYNDFLQAVDLDLKIASILKEVDVNKTDSVEHASSSIHSLILNTKISQELEENIIQAYKNLNTTHVAVRSSATAEDGTTTAWAGQLETYLNTDEHALIDNIQKCWASLYTPRAIFYQIKNNLHNQPIAVAVVVQAMIQSELSGIAFSVHPISKNPNQLIVEAGYGLGEAIVSGQVTPNNYIVQKNPRAILEKNIFPQLKGLYKEGWRELEPELAEKQVLTDAQILELSELIIEIEHHYKFPCDIEWAYANNQFYITQSRPITTL